MVGGGERPVVMWWKCTGGFESYGTEWGMLDGVALVDGDLVLYLNLRVDPAVTLTIGFPER